MMEGRGGRVWASMLPWLGASLVWFGLLGPMRADQENRLTRQGRVRQDRLNAEQALREIQTLRARVGQALGSACRASTDPAALRQRTVAATAGLALSPFSLSVSGGTGGGAVIEAEGAYGVVAELLRRLGDPGRGGFLRSASLRISRGRWSVSAGTGALETFPRALMPSKAPCPSAPDPGPVAVSPRPAGGSARQLPQQQFVPTAPDLAPAPAPPLSLVAFLTAEGKRRVSVVAGGEVRVVSVGDVVDGWTCVSIDRDEGAVFTSASRERLVLKAGR